MEKRRGGMDAMKQKKQDGHEKPQKSPKAGRKAQDDK